MSFSRLRSSFRDLFASRPRALVLLAVLNGFPLLAFPPKMLLKGWAAVLAVVVLWVLLGWGLLSYRPWARLLTVFVHGFNIISRLLVLFPNSTLADGSVNLGLLISTVIAILLSGWVLYEIDKPDMLLAFEA